MPYENYTEEMLGLKDVIITNINQTEKCCNIHIQMPRKVHICPVCGSETDQIHDYRKQRIKDIPPFGKFTILLLKKRRYVCPICHKKFYEAISFLPKYHRLTNRLSAWIIAEFRKIHSMKSYTLFDFTGSTPTIEIEPKNERQISLSLEKLNFII